MPGSTPVTPTLFPKALPVAGTHACDESRSRGARNALAEATSVGVNPSSDVNA